MNIVRCDAGEGKQGEGSRRLSAELDVGRLFDLIVWYEPSNAIHGFQLCYGKPESERALTWLKGRGFSHWKIDSGEDEPEANRAPILLPDGSFPTTEVSREFRQRSDQLPKSLRNFVLAKLKQFAGKQKR